MDDDKTEVSNQGDGEPLAPIRHYVNFKTRRVLMCRGENAEADAVDRGFKRVTANHFFKYIEQAKKGFRVKSKKK